MFVLELVTKDFEGVWSNNVFVSKNRDVLLSRIAEEKQKYIKKQVELYEDTTYEVVLPSLFAIGDLEHFILEKVTEGRKDYEKNDNYHLDGQVFEQYKELRDYIISIAEPVAETLNVEKKMVEKIINGGFYESLRFRVSEIEEI